jgi:hypothetical protein
MRSGKELAMKHRTTLLAAVVIGLSPAPIAAAPGNPQGPANGQGWVHLNGPTETGQPGAECGDPGATRSPGRAADARGSAFNEDGIAHSVYAGEQPQNSRNRASSSQYDTACLLDHPN